MTPETRLALAMLFVFAVGMTLTFFGAGAGRLAAFVVGFALMLFSSKTLNTLLRR